MAVNWSFPSNSSLHHEFYHCSNSTALVSFFIIIIVRCAIIFPLATLVLCLGFKKWQQKRSIKSMSETDVISYHISFMQLTEAPGAALFLAGFYVPSLSLVGACISSFAITGETLFHVLTCVQRYLAVVHPITYLGLQKATGVGIRSICIGGVWLSTIGWMSLIILYAPSAPVIPFFCFSTLSFLVVSFCSLSVLCVLIRPRPGEVGGDREKVDQSKRKAFRIMMATTAVLWFTFVGYVVAVALEHSALLSYNDGCILLAVGVWFNLPSSLMVPLLYLQREGKLKCCSARAN